MQAYPWNKEINRPPTVTQTTTEKLQRIRHKVMQIINSLPNRIHNTNLSKKENETLKNLKSKQIAIMPSDKGGEFCIMNKDEYIKAGEQHLDNRSLYKLVPRMTAGTIEDKINKQWRSICSQTNIPKWIYNSYCTKNSKLPNFYHLIKTHKPPNVVKIRPIISSTGSPSLKLTWLLNKMLTPLLSTIKSHIKDTDELMSNIQQLPKSQCIEYHYPVSYDVAAMYTSIPVNEALNSITNLSCTAFNNSIYPITTRNIIEILHTIIKNSYFTFKDRIYQQISGLPMGLSISGIIATIFIDRIEQRALNSFQQCKFFYRYVDDSFGLVKNKEAAEKLLTHLNNQHDSILFEIEHPNTTNDNHNLQLLDLSVQTNKTGTINFNFYRKKARKKVFIHARSHMPKSQKISIIQNEACRIKHRSSKDSDATKAIQDFKKTLSINGYDDKTISNTINKNRGERRHSTQETFYLNIPFFNDKTDSAIKNIFRKEKIDIRLSRRSETLSQKLRPQLSNKPTCIWPDCHTADNGNCFIKCTVYRIFCSPCGGDYIGSSERHLHKRIREHTHSGVGSEIHSHLKNCGHGVAKTSIIILTTERDKINARIAESFYQKKLRPTLNRRQEEGITNILI